MRPPNDANLTARGECRETLDENKTGGRREDPFFDDATELKRAPALRDPEFGARNGGDGRFAKGETRRRRTRRLRPVAQERLQKVIAQAGVASRRKAETLIADGRVRVNGRVVRELGTKVDPRKDKVEVDGRRLVAEKPVYLVLNKPRAVVSTLDDPEGRETVGQLMKAVPERVFPVGRLDYHTSGVLLLTNDGAMSEALLRPGSGVPKQYLAKMAGHLDVPELDKLRNGVRLDDGYVTRPAEVYVERTEERVTWVHVTLFEGKNRQIHRMGDAIGHRVMRLSRLSFAEITTEGLRPGRYRPLTGKELERLKKRYLNPAKRRQNG